MVIPLLTKSHGVIDAGFNKAFMKFSHLGKYSFETKDLCGLAQNLADNPRLKEARIFGYDTEKVWELEEGYNSEFFQKRMNFFLDGNNEIVDFVKKNRKLSAEEKAKLMGSQIKVPVRIHRFREMIEVGEYELEKNYFVQFLYYVVRGGYNGWTEEMPDFAKAAFLAIQSSRNRLYKEGIPFNLLYSSNR
jgi:hypothetical protein